DRRAARSSCRGIQPVRPRELRRPERQSKFGGVRHDHQHLRPAPGAAGGEDSVVNQECVSCPPASRRAIRDASKDGYENRGAVGVPSSTSLATSSPIAGPILKPCPEPPPTSQALLASGW